MTWNKPPLSVIVVGCMYLAVGAIGFVYHFTELLPFRYDGLLVELTELVAIVCGACLLRGYNWGAGLPSPGSHST